MQTTDQQLHRTPLYDEHLRLKAKMVPFGGWEMPVQYTGILDEYWQCRKAAALFDICHMGEFIVEGDGAVAVLEKIFSAPVATIPLKRSRYGLMLNEKGGVIDDLIIFRLADKKFMLVVNAANIAKDFAHIKANADPSTRCENISDKTGKLDLQGPLAREALSRLCPDITRLKYFQFDEFDLLGEKCLVSRTGYTGELGYEIFYPSSKTKILWKKILENDKVKPAGLGARDVLRLEMAYSLYGHEINDATSPLEAGLDPFIDQGKNFIGKNALLEQKKNGPARKIVYFVSADRRSPRQGHKIFTSTGAQVGEVTSGTYSPALEKGIGIGLIAAQTDLSEGKIAFGAVSGSAQASIGEKPFYKQGSLKN